MAGHRGQGVRSLGRSFGGSGSSSSWTIDSAPSRTALPTQSAPVSPPPITTTRLPAAVSARAGGAGVAGARRVSSRATQRLRS